MGFLIRALLHLWYAPRDLLARVVPNCMSCEHCALMAVPNDVRGVCQLQVRTNAEGQEEMRAVRPMDWCDHFARREA